MYIYCIDGTKTRSDGSEISVDELDQVLRYALLQAGLADGDAAADALAQKLQGSDGWWKSYLKGRGMSPSMDWFTGKSAGNHRFSHEIWFFPVKCPLNQSNDTSVFLISSTNI